MANTTQDAGPDPTALGGLLFNQSSDALLVVDPISERVLNANPAALALTEMTLDQLVGLSMRILVRHEQERQDWSISPPSDTPLPGHQNFLLRTSHRDRWVPVSIRVTRLEQPDCGPLTLCRLRDRRDQIESQRRLLRAEAELRRLLSTITDAVYSGRIEPDGRWHIRHVSPRLHALTGPHGEPAVREPIVDSEDRPRWRELIARATSGLPGELEYRLRRPVGRVIWVRETIVVTPDEGGLQVHGVLTDISDRKLAEQEAIALAHEQTRRLDALARLAVTVAHDFNNVVTGVLGNVNLARLDSTARARVPGPS